MSEVTVIQLRKALIDYFNITELRTLCMELGQDYESFGGNGKDGKALEIATWSQRHGRFDELVAIVKRERPHAFAGANVTAAPPSQGGATNSPQQPQSGGNTFNFYGNVTRSAIGEGNVNAENLAGGDMYVAGGDINIHSPETKDDFKTQLAELQKLVKEAVEAGAFAKESDAEDALYDLRRVGREIDESQPDANSMATRLKDVKEILDRTTEAAKSAGKTVGALVKAAAVSGALIDTVTKLFS